MTMIGPIPTTFEECQARASVAADKYMAAIRRSLEEGKPVEGFVLAGDSSATEEELEFEHYEKYVDELGDLTRAMNSDGGANFASCMLSELSLVSEKPLGRAVSAVINAAEEELMQYARHDHRGNLEAIERQYLAGSRNNLRQVLEALCGFYGVDKVRAAIDQMGR